MYNLAFVLEGEHFVIEIFLMASSFSDKMARCFIFSKPVKGENFLRYPLSSKPNDFMPLIARKNQGSTPMPLLK